MKTFKILCSIIGYSLIMVILTQPELVYSRPMLELDAPDSSPSVVFDDITRTNSSWWNTVQEDISQSEYDITWQEHTYLADLDAAYQAPNRKHNLRTYFTPQGIHLIPRLFEGEKPSWELDLSLASYSYDSPPLSNTEGGSQTVDMASLIANGNQISFDRRYLTEWYRNDEGGLKQGFILHKPPPTSPIDTTSRIVLDLRVSGDLNPYLNASEDAIEFTTSDGEAVLRYSDLVVHDVTGNTLPAHLELVQSVIRISIDVSIGRFPINIDPLFTGLTTSPSWEYLGDQDQNDSRYGCSVSTAGDVNGDDFSDIIVSAPLYDHGESDEGIVLVFYGSGSGLQTSYNWMAESNQVQGHLGLQGLADGGDSGAATAGDLNGDGYSDVIISSTWYGNGQSYEGAVFVWYGSENGLNNGVNGNPSNANWHVESDLASAWLGKAVGTAGDVNGDGYSDIIIGGGMVGNGSVFVWHGSAAGLNDGIEGTLSNAAWKAESDQISSMFGNSVATAGDVNGDGYSDIIVGGLNYDNGQTDEGMVWLWYGSANGVNNDLDGTPSNAPWSAESNQASSFFGRSVGTAGDVNGDGYSDIIVGAPYYDNGEEDEGVVFVWHGSANGMNNGVNGTPSNLAWRAESNVAKGSFINNFGMSVRAAGDVNGDGYNDIIVGSPGRYVINSQNYEAVFVWSGSINGINNDVDGTPDNATWSLYHEKLGGYSFGYAVGTAGDVNGDGFSDIIVGSQYQTEYASGEKCNVCVYHGSAMGLSLTTNWIVESDQASVEFGWAVGTAGDVNGDGYHDVIIGSPYYDGGLIDEGRSYVYNGSATGLSPSADWIAESEQAGALFGWSVSTAGDVNGDGYSDIIIGAYLYDYSEIDEGSAFTWYGSATGVNQGVDGNPSNTDWNVTSNQADAQFGWSVGTAGDVNGDGFSDVIVGAPFYENGQDKEGCTFVYHGSKTGLSTTSNWTAESEQLDARFGWSVGTAGDMNRDGYSDVIIGSYLYDNGEIDEGSAFVWLGSTTGVNQGVNGTPINAAWNSESDQPYASFGSSVGTAGDVNGDGFSDVIIDAPSNVRRVYVYHGSTTGLSNTANWIVESDQPSVILGKSTATAGDVNGDGFSDVIINASGDSRRAQVYLGDIGGLSTTADWVVESDQENAGFGYAVGTAGDVNGDGFADVIIGAPYYDNGQLDEGRAYLYYGGGGDGMEIRPRQIRSDGVVAVDHLGMSDSGSAIRLSLFGRMPLGREELRFQWQIAPLGVPFTATSIISGTTIGWTDTMTTGVHFDESIGGLDPETPYHWRVRLLYQDGNALSLLFSRWIHMTWSGWNETDFRTNIPGYKIYLPLMMR